MERYARVRELIITSDDPHTPIRELEMLAHTVWNEPCRDDRTKGCCREPNDCAPGCCGCEHCADGMMADV